MDELRARAFLDLVLGTDSRPRAPRAADAAGQDGGAARQPPGAGPAGGAAGGFAGRVALTVPLGTAAGLADRPGELAGLGPVDPWLARDLVTAAARNPETTWCVTVTDGQGHAVGHGCARPEPQSRAKRAGPGPPAGGDGFSFTPASRDGPPGGYGTWRLRVPGGGPGLIVAIDTLATHDCGHRHQARGHDPGSKAPAPSADPARDLHQSGLPAARRPVRLRAQHPVRGGRTDVLVQRGPEMPARPPAQAAARVDRRPAPRRHLPVDHPGRTQLPHRTHPLPHLTREHGHEVRVHQVSARREIRELPPTRRSGSLCGMIRRRRRLETKAKREVRAMTKRMGRVICGITISADGYSAGLNQTEERPFGDDGGAGSGDKLHAWMFDTPEENRARSTR